MQAHTPPLQVRLAAHELPGDFAWWRACEKLRESCGFWLLDSSLPQEEYSRFSFAGCDPYWVVRVRGRRIDLECRREVREGFARGDHGLEGDPLTVLRGLLGPAQSDLPTPAGVGSVAELPFIGGAVGYLGYELAGTHDPIELHARDDLGFPDAVLFFVDQVLAFDHLSRRAYALGLGFASNAAAADSAAEKAAASLAFHVEACRAEGQLLYEGEGGADREGLAPIARDRALPEVVRARFDDGAYARAVGAVLDEIAAGNVYQANFTQRLDVPFEGEPWPLYLDLRSLSPAPFAAYLDLPDSSAAILSSSPERFLKLDPQGRVESRPIKGTRPRGSEPDVDERLRQELERSPKDRAENLMIVDLVRNDLGRVCETGSVEVPDFQRVEAYRSVYQLVSTVTGHLRAECDAFDLVRASFPPGSMTGAPKLSAMRILDRLEPQRRGVYSGAIGYFDQRGGLDLSVVIRTLLLREGVAHLHVGGAVVADSDPRGEYLESLDKAYAPLVALARRGAKPRSH